MKYDILPNGDLKISLQRGDRRKLFDGRKPGDDRQPDFGSDDFMGEVFARLIANSELDWSRPEYIGALTDAPILVVYGNDRPLKEGEDPAYHLIIGRWPDPADGLLKTWTRDPVLAWGFMNYQIRCPQEDLFNDDFVIFQSGQAPEEQERICLKPSRSKPTPTTN
jgi:hypothetical protein